MSKPPTPQAISALLRKAGFERSRTIPGRVKWDGTRLRGSTRTSGYKVKGDGNRVVIGCLTGRVVNPRRSDEQRQAALQRYADALTAEGFSARLLHEDGRSHVIVTAKEDEDE